MEHHLLEHRGLEEAHDSGVVCDIPNNRTSIERSRHCLGVVFRDLDVRNSSSVFLHGGLHDLGLASNSPDSNFSLHSSRNNLVARVGEGEGSYSVIVSIIDGIEELSTLGQKGADLTVGPTGQHRLSVIHEPSYKALKARHLNSEQFLSGLSIPHSDVVNRGSREELRVGVREGDGVYSLEVAGVPQLGFQLISVSPVDCGLAGTDEDVSEVSGGRD